MRSICVFCGSSPGADPAFRAAAAALGRFIGSSGRRLVYGGGNVGLMGALADAALSAGAEVIGVIPESLAAKEVAHRGVTRLHVVGSMHERKAMMADLSDAFLALPGGIGTLEEFFEVWTWGQLGLHARPYGLLNVSGFYDPLLRFLDQMVQQRFIKQEHRDMLFVADDHEELIGRMSRHHPVSLPKWVDRGTT